MIIFEITIGIILSIIALIAAPFILAIPIVGIAATYTRVKLFHNKKYLKKNMVWKQVAGSSNPYKKIPYCQILEVKDQDGTKWVRYAKYNKNCKFEGEDSTTALAFNVLYKPDKEKYNCISI